MSLWVKSSSVIIQMKAIEQFFHSPYWLVVTLVFEGEIP